MHDQRDRGLESIIGEQLSAVSFVQDYVEFHFDGPVIRALTNPVARTRGGRISFPDAGSRDALCGFVGRKVLSVNLVANEGLTIEFGVEEFINVPLDAASYRGPEALHFQVTSTAPVQVYA